MNVLMISGDKHILNEGSETHTRLMLQRAAVDRLDVMVWPQLHSGAEVMYMAKQHTYDVVTAQDPFWRGLLAWWVACRAKAKLNIQVHTDLVAQPWWRRTLAYFVLHRADSIRVVSEKIKNDLAFLHLHAPIAVLPIFIDFAPFQAIEYTPHPRFKKTILWIGRFEQEKDPVTALTVLQDVRATGVNAGLVLLGSGSLEKTLRTRADTLGPVVEFPGWQKDIRPYLQMADVVISTSRHESYGVSMLEALAAHVPVVAPNIGIAKEAGAIVVERSALAATVANVLREGARSKLLLVLPSKEEWVKRWRKTL